MRPTKRMLMRPSPRIFSSAGRLGASGDPLGVDGDRHDAGRREAHLLEFPSIEVGVPERQVHLTHERPQLLAPKRGKPEQPGIVRSKEGGGRDVVVLEHARPVERRERRGHRRGKREVKDRDVPAACIGIGEGPHIAAQVVVDRQREEVGCMPGGPQHVPHPPRAVADRVSLVRCRDPLVDDHDRGRIVRRSSASLASRASAGRIDRQRPIQRRPELPQLFEPLELLELLPEIPGDLGGLARRRGKRLLDKAEQGAAEVPAAQALQRGILRLDDRILDPRIVQDGLHQPRDVEGVLCVVQHAAAVHRGRHGRRRVGQHRDVLVERLDDRHAETLRARSRRGTGRRRRTAPSALRSRRGRGSGRPACRAAR